MEPASSIFKMPREARLWYKEHSLIGHFTGKSLKESAKKQCKILQEKQITFAWLTIELLDIMKKAVDNPNQTINQKFLVTVIPRRVKVKELEKSIGCPFAEKKKGEKAHCHGVDDNEKKYFSTIFIIRSIARNESIEVKGMAPHLMREHQFCGNLDVKKLIKILDIKPEKTYKPEISESDLASTSSHTSESEPEKPEEPAKPKPAKPITVSEYIVSRDPEHPPTPRPKLSFPENRPGSRQSTTSSESESQSEEDDCKCTIF